MNNPLIEIILPVYNGRKYLREQILSIINQTYKNIHILIRNDGSTDDSDLVIDSLQKEFSNQIIVINDNLGNIGVIKSIEVLLKRTHSKYIMFCDQDDIWLNFKIEVTLKSMLRLEKKYPQKPLLVCTDVTCVDSTGMNIIYQSFFKSRKFFDEALNNDNTFLAMNIVQGCTMMINSVSLNYLFPFPQKYGHDAYIGAVINHFGKVYYLHVQTMLYRQHNKNVYGAPSVNGKYFIRKMKYMFEILKEEQSNFSQLPFNTSKWKWIVYKIYFSVKRIFMDIK